MRSQQVISIDPFEMESRFSMEDSLGNNSFTFCSKIDVESLDPLLERLPELEADFVFLYFQANKKQSDIAKIFGCTQAAVSYRLKKAVRRIKFLLSIPKYTEEEMRGDLGLIMNELDVEILVGMYQTTCQSWVADRLGLSQGLVRHRFFKNLGLLKKKQDSLGSYFILFEKISENFNILKEVSLPQWHHNKGHVVMPIENN
jgi:hypothetical protein